MHVMTITAMQTKAGGDKLLAQLAIRTWTDNSHKTVSGDEFAIVFSP